MEANIGRMAGSARSEETVISVNVPNYNRIMQNMHLYFVFDVKEFNLDTHNFVVTRSKLTNRLGRGH